MEETTRSERASDPKLDDFVVRSSGANPPTVSDDDEAQDRAGAGLGMVKRLAALCVFVFALGGVIYLASSHLRTDMLVGASRAEARAHVAGEWPEGATGAYFETLGEWVELLDPEQRELALRAARRAVEADPDRAFAWARIAYFSGSETEAAGEEAIDALRASMAACPLCDAELVRWRFNHVLAHWDQMPDDIRRTAFTHADMLRWTGGNAEFLAEMRVKANNARIPYDAYRAAVDTPVRSLEIEMEDGF